jgi:hypothetical protein
MHAQPVWHIHSPDQWTPFLRGGQRGDPIQNLLRKRAASTPPLGRSIDRLSLTHLVVHASDGHAVHVCNFSSVRSYAIL